jgi:cytochrome c5
MMPRFVWCVLLSGVVTGCGGEPPAGSGAASGASAGETTYQRFCFSCHQAGVAGAPRTGDRAAWAARIAKGEEALLAATIAGIPPGMPPRGMCLQCSDEDLREAVRYLVDRSR